MVQVLFIGYQETDADKLPNLAKKLGNEQFTSHKNEDVNKIVNFLSQNQDEDLIISVRGQPIVLHQALQQLTQGKGNSDFKLSKTRVYVHPGVEDEENKENKEDDNLIPQCFQEVHVTPTYTRILGYKTQEEIDTAFLGDCYMLFAEDVRKEFGFDGDLFKLILPLSFKLAENPNVLELEQEIDDIFIKPLAQHYSKKDVVNTVFSWLETLYQEQLVELFELFEKREDLYAFLDKFNGNQLYVLLNKLDDHPLLAWLNKLKVDQLSKLLNKLDGVQLFDGLLNRFKTRQLLSWLDKFNSDQLFNLLNKDSNKFYTLLSNKFDTLLSKSNSYNLALQRDDCFKLFNELNGVQLSNLLNKLNGDNLLGLLDKLHSQKFWQLLDKIENEDELGTLLGKLNDDELFSFLDKFHVDELEKILKAFNNDVNDVNEQEYNNPFEKLDFLQAFKLYKKIWKQNGQTEGRGVLVRLLNSQVKNQVSEALANSWSKYLAFTLAPAVLCAVVALVALHFESQLIVSMFSHGSQVANGAANVAVVFAGVALLAMLIASAYTRLNSDQKTLKDMYVNMPAASNGG